MIAPYRATRKLKTQMALTCSDLYLVGSTNASLRSFNGGGGSWCAGSILPRRL